MVTLNPYKDMKIKNPAALAHFSKLRHCMFMASLWEMVPRNTASIVVWSVDIYLACGDVAMVCIQFASLVLSDPEMPTRMSP